METIFYMKTVTAHLPSNASYKWKCWRRTTYRQNEGVCVCIQRRWWGVTVTRKLSKTATEVASSHGFDHQEEDGGGGNPYSWLHKDMRDVHVYRVTSLSEIQWGEIIVRCIEVGDRRWRPHITWPHHVKGTKKSCKCIQGPSNGSQAHANMEQGHVAEREHVLERKREGSGSSCRCLIAVCSAVDFLFVVMMMIMSHGQC